MHLVSAAASGEDALVAEAICNGLGLASSYRTRTLPIRFEYFTPLDTPALQGRESQIEDLSPVTGGQVLAFGMIEGRPPIAADMVVIDPQQPLGLHGDVLAGVDAERVALVLNRAEAMSLTDRADPRAAIEDLAAQHRYEVVVVKIGARGLLVADEHGIRAIAPHWSDRVAPLGTGDCFTSAFAAFWFDGASALEAADGASICTAQYTATGDLEPPVFDPAAAEPVPVNDARVYLASPFFTLAEEWQVHLCRSQLSPHVFSPLHDVGHGDLEVAQSDIDGLHTCDSVFAVIEGNDPGTLYEVGYAAALGLPIVAYAQRPDREGAKMISGLGGEVLDDLATALYRAQWKAMQHAHEQS
ncbi:MAG: PfkB family carbohydrate kinase [Acidimicrobiales bacterium]